MTEKVNYNDIPVEFCRNATCCSLAVVEDEEGLVFCRDCGCTKTEKAHVDKWAEYYFMAHGKYLV